MCSVTGEKLHTLYKAINLKWNEIVYLYIVLQDWIQRVCHTQRRVKTTKKVTASI